MNGPEQEPNEELESSIDHKVTNEDIENLVKLIENEGLFDGVLSDEEKADLIAGIREYSILNREIDERQEEDLNEKDTIGEIWGLLEQYGLPAEEILINTGLIE